MKRIASSIAILTCIVLLHGFILGVALCGAYQPGGGIFALYDDKMGIPAQVYSNPNIDGVTFRYMWNDIQPQPNSFNWAKIDADISAAHRYGKKISLIIVPGVHTPSWVYTAGATSFAVVWDRPFGGFPECSQQRIPIPWDNTYLSLWTKFVKELGQRYASDPTLLFVSPTGLNSYTGENGLPHSRSMVRGLPKCPNIPDYDAQWKAAGYSQDKILSAWMTILDAFARSFPNQRLVACIIPVGFPDLAGETGFPGLGPGRRRANLTLVHEMLKAAVNRYGSRVILKNNGLAANQAWRPKEDLATSPVAYQTLSRVSRDRRCVMNHFVAPCDPGTMLRSALNDAINSGAVYIEVYAIDVINPDLQGVLADAHSRLNARAKP